MQCTNLYVQVPCNQVPKMSINVSTYLFWYVCESIFSEFYLTYIIRCNMQYSACNQCFTQPALSGFIIQKQENYLCGLREF